MYHKLTIAIPQGISSFYHNLVVYVKKKTMDLNNRTPDNRTLQFTDHFIWEHIYLELKCNMSQQILQKRSKLRCYVVALFLFLQFMYFLFF